ARSPGLRAGWAGGFAGCGRRGTAAPGEGSGAPRAGGDGGGGRTGAGWTALAGVSKGAGDVSVARGARSTELVGLRAVGGAATGGAGSAELAETRDAGSTGRAATRGAAGAGRPGPCRPFVA